MLKDFPGGSDSKESSCSAGDLVRSLGWEDPLEEGMAIHSTILTWRMPMDRGAWQATFRGVERVGHNIATNIFSHAIIENSGIFIADPVSLYLLGFPGGTNG